MGLELRNGAQSRTDPPVPAGPQTRPRLYHSAVIEAQIPPAPACRGSELPAALRIRALHSEWDPRCTGAGLSPRSA